MDEKEIDLLAIFNEIKDLDIWHNKGLNNPRESERQYLYGDVSDWIRDYYSYLSLEEREILAKLIIGNFVIQNRLL